MKHPLLPDYDFDTFKGVTPDFLKSINKSCILCDIDNTLVSYDTPCPTDEVIAWIKDLQKNNIKIMFVSNNGKERVEIFNEKFNLPYLCNSGKPLPKSVNKALKILDEKKENTVILGDQLLTDVATASFSEITSIWVPPIKKVDNLFFRIKGLIEKPFIKHYLKEKNKKTEKNI